jgi:formate hydrogenlyase subunit 3/multisubunit Na+/H+ antiporter MnhD subunit
MNPVVKNILAVVLGLFIGGIVNTAIVMISGSIIPPPEGTDLKTMEGLLAAMPLMEPKHFLMPFLAHALGTLVGAFIAAKIAANNKMTFAMVIGCCFLVGGIMNIVMLPSPLWFTIVDLLLAYIPMAYFGGTIVSRKNT